MRLHRVFQRCDSGKLCCQRVRSNFSCGFSGHQFTHHLQRGRVNEMLTFLLLSQQRLDFTPQHCVVPQEVPRIERGGSRRVPRHAETALPPMPTFRIHTSALGSTHEQPSPRQPPSLPRSQSILSKLQQFPLCSIRQRPHSTTLLFLHRPPLRPLRRHPVPQRLRWVRLIPRHVVQRQVNYITASFLEPRERAK